MKLHAEEGRKRIFWVTVSLTIKNRKPTRTLSTALPCNDNTHSEQGAPKHTHTGCVCTSQSIYVYVYVHIYVGGQVYVGVFE